MARNRICGGVFLAPTPGVCYRMRNHCLMPEGLDVATCWGTLTAISADSLRRVGVLCLQGWTPMPSANSYVTQAGYS